MRGYTFALAALVVFAGCEKADDDADDVVADTAAIAPAPAPATVSPEPVVTELDEVDDSGIEGDATATHSATDVTVSIVLKEGGKADVSYPAHIHTGTCDKGGPVAVELSPVTNLQSSKTVPLSSLPANQDAFVQVHDPSGKAVACGNMKGHGNGTTGDTVHTTTH
jgi:hypothetical protein